MNRVGVVDVARACGVSPSTVCRALNDKSDINAKTRERVLAACARLGYSKNLSASNLRLRKSDTVVCLAPELTNELFVDKLYSLKREVLSAGFKWRMVGYDDHEEAAGLVRDVIGSGPAGLISLFSLPPDLRTVLGHNRVPVVAYDLVQKDVDAVALDRGEGVSQAVTALLDRGREAIVGVGFSKDSERGVAFQKAMTSRGVTVTNERFIDVPHGRDLFQYGYDMIVAATRRRFDAVLAVNDACAIGAIRALSERGLSVPDDVGVVGMDNIMVTRFTVPALSTVSQPKEEMARRCVELLNSRIADPSLPVRSVRLATRFIPRESH